MKSHLPATPAALTLLGLAALFVSAAALRAWGLDWGVPHPGRFYPYHPDEGVVLHAVSSVNPLWGDFAPSFYHYGSFTILLIRLAYDFLAAFLGWGAVPRFDQPFAAWLADFARLMLVGRWVSVLLGAATAPLTYGLAARLYGPRAGWLAALFAAAAPLSVVLSHYVTVDVPASFLTTLSLFCSAAALRASEPRRLCGWLAGAGAAAGLAAGTKYNSVLVLAAAAVPVWVHWRGEAAGLRRSALVGGGAAAVACLLVFLASTPGALLEPELFRRHLLIELSRNAGGQGLVFEGTPPALLYHLGVSLPIALEWPLYLLALAGAAQALLRRRPADALLLIFLFLFLAPLAVAERKFLRYVAPLVPVLTVLAARCVHEGLSGRWRPLWAGWAAAAAVGALASSVAHVAVMAGPDPRDRAAAFLRREARPGEIVALGTDAWYYTPPIHPSAGSVKVSTLYGGPPVWDAVLPGTPRPDLARLPEFLVLAPASYPAPAGTLPVEKLKQYRPEWVVLTDYEWEDPHRLRGRDPGYRHDLLRLEAALAEEYRLAREFRPRPSLAGFTWWRSGTPPHDWRYFMPTVRIYARKDAGRP